MKSENILISDKKKRENITHSVAHSVTQSTCVVAEEGWVFLLVLAGKRGKEKIKEGRVERGGGKLVRRDGRGEGGKWAPH